MISGRILLILLSIIIIVFACSCRDKGSEATFCKADFVSKVKVDQVYELARDNHTYEILYTPAKVVLADEIRTPAHESMCGVRMRKGQELVLAGSITSCGFLRIDSCLKIDAAFDTNKFKNINCSSLVVI